MIPLFIPGIISTTITIPIISSGGSGGGGGGGGGGGTSYLVNENFEGSGAPSGWSGTANFDYTASPISGVQSCYIDGTSPVSARVTWADAGPEIYGQFKFRVDSLPDSFNTIFRLTDSTLNESSLQIVLLSSGALVVRDNTGILYQTTTATVSTSTVYNVWYHYKVGTGSNSVCELWFSTSGSLPTDPNYYVTGNNGGGVSNSVNALWYSGTDGSTTTPSKFAIDDVLIGINPPGGDITTSLAAHWSFDETSGNYIDSVNGNNLVATGPTGSAAGQIGNAVSVTRLTGYQIQDNSGLNNVARTDNLAFSSNQSFTITIWAKPSVISGNVLYWQWGSGPQTAVKLTMVDSSTTTFLFGGSDGTSTMTLTNTSSLSTGTWYFICAGYDATGGQAFLSINNGTSATTSWSTGTENGGGWYLGGTAFSSDTYGGLLDDMRIYKRALSSADITTLYNWRG